MYLGFNKRGHYSTSKLNYASQAIFGVVCMTKGGKNSTPGAKKGLPPSRTLSRQQH